MHAVHDKEDMTVSARPFADPIAQGSLHTFHDPTDIESRLTADPLEPICRRSGMSNAKALERAVAELEGADAGSACASGMTAIGLFVRAHLSAGDHVVAAIDHCCDTHTLLTEEFTRVGVGVGVTFADAADAGQTREGATERARPIYSETIAKPSLGFADLSGLARVSRSLGALLCIGDTVATLALCRPVEHGADLVVHSASTFFGGHHDLSAGVVVGRADLVGRIRRCGDLFGPTVAPLDAWLALRGIGTLAPRRAWASATAAIVAVFFTAHRAVAAVHYPGLPDYPRKALARRLPPDGGGAMLSFDRENGAVAPFSRAHSLIQDAPGLGGASTTICYPPRPMPSDPAGVVELWENRAARRLSIGLEAAVDRTYGLFRALDRAIAPLTIAQARA